ncbi:metal-dependent hydrolase family protein [Actinophytocola algeriensis]|uniref:Imidazolonepropionase-like amidohydrolase n=1 Tax=Actinophytocola algeriensis TaxID=1768010 RepID=A0A7W7QC85_9PSEU|nr:amidohydrolase family protein [Actinophytocola algeriensis]MBB4910985.1 imidazolonepropionase-like amidohydrolase [Actinophytocola algeriensis]MBE1473978.1 imidazolonepropionase-like amidohydrolase [Actinophytocola algeriensis]
MSLAIINAAVFDGESAELVDGPVLVEDGRISAIGGSGAADRVLDARGGTVLPGLIDAHCHAYGVSLDLLSIEGAPLSYLALTGARRLKAALARGFTTVRDVAGGDPGIARAIAEGTIPAPRYLYTGAALSQTGGHGDARGVDSDVCGCHVHMVEVVDGVDAVRAAARDRFRRGAHAIKMMTSGGVMSLADPIRIPQYSAEEIRAVTDEAARRGSYVAAHAYSAEAIRHSVENGVRSIEHGNLMDAETAALMASRGAFLVPTLATYDAISRRGADNGLAPVSQEKNLEVLHAGANAIELARAAGVAIGFGTDLMGDLDDEQLNGLRLQSEIDGVLNALRSATSVNADLIGRPDLGRVQVGAVADLVIVDGDPFTEPAVLWGPRRTVVQAGVVVGE